MARDPGPRLRGLLVWGGATLTLAALAGWLVPDLVAAGGVPAASRPFDAWLVIGCEVAALLAATWLWLLVGLVVREAVSGTTCPRGAVPPLLRRVVLAACGVGLLGSLASPAHAGSLPSPLAGLPLPDRPTTHATRPPEPSPSSTPAAAAGEAGRRSPTVRVQRGDTLWDLAAADLPDRAPLAAVDERWRVIHAANREVVGDDPDLILPGQRLRLPPSPAVPPTT
ncbi:LysM peptidoglycan-binding domain-containing protein [Nocardioides sp. GXQ0305]|uniref:LysM peptidoglycan-binding domain-containing protein n=1 Tax=Nocardioides sp. GXQ0305 TaxID=3423912 RepID=UPI003D7E0BEB